MKICLRRVLVCFILGVLVVILGNYCILVLGFMFVGVMWVWICFKMIESFCCFYVIIGDLFDCVDILFEFICINVLLFSNIIEVIEWVSICLFVVVNNKCFCICVMCWWEIKFVRKENG